MPNGHEKGSEFERLIAKCLSSWLTGGADTRALWRTPGSGGMAHRLSPELQRWTGGDIGVLDKDCATACHFVTLFHTELKHYKSLDWHKMLTVERRGFLWETWDKTAALAQLAHRLPLMIVKQNRQHVVAFAPVELWHRATIPCVSFFGITGATPLAGLMQFAPGPFLQTAEYLLHGTSPRPHIPQRRVPATGS